MPARGRGQGGAAAAQPPADQAAALAALTAAMQAAQQLGADPAAIQALFAGNAARTLKEERARSTSSWLHSRSPVPSGTAWHGTTGPATVTVSGWTHSRVPCTRMAKRPRTS
jgi:hypothetical protein